MHRGHDGVGDLGSMTGLDDDHGPARAIAQIPARLDHGLAGPDRLRQLAGIYPGRADFGGAPGMS